MKETINSKRGLSSILIVLVILIIDQTIKVWVKTHMYLGESIEITSWFYIDFVENIGMAYGMNFLNKLVLSLFRLVAIIAITVYIFKLLHERHRLGYLVCLSMILAGAAGNLFDAMFYGLVFNASTPYNIAEWVTFGDGYAPFLYGKVVDMFYFPLIETTWPAWMPFVGGQHYIFFSPVFNFADASISVSVVLLLLFYRKDFETIGTTLRRGTRWERVEKTEGQESLQTD